MKIDCIKIVENIIDNIKEKIELLKEKKIIPHLAIIKNNDNGASDKYVDIKIKKAKELGVKVSLFSNFTNELELIQLIKNINNDSDIHGYIVQLPLPKGFDEKRVFEHIDVNKDVDGLSPYAIFRNYNNSPSFYPKACTANGIMEIFNHQKISLESKNVVIINRSAIVGKPLSLLMLKANATVTICHSKTNDLIKHTKNADIIVVAVGIPNFLTAEMINENAIIIDAGINVINNKVCGDSSEKANQKAAFYTPVPNGVGKLTVAMIFKNLIDLIG